MTILADLSEDAHLYLSLRFPKAKPSLLQFARVWCFSPGLWALTTHRVAFRYGELNHSGVLKTLLKIWPGVAVRIGNYLSKVLTKCDLLPSTKVEAGVFLSNKGHIVLGARSIGSGSTIHERVTIGMGLPGTEVPEIGRNVWIGPECVIYGEITVGDGATVAPGTVLTKSIPPRSVVQGNPARIVKREFENSRLRKSLSPSFESLDHTES